MVAAEAKERYLQAKRVVRKAQNDKWVELRRTLQKHFQENQRRFWKRVTKKSEKQEIGKV